MAGSGGGTRAADRPRLRFCRLQGPRPAPGAWVSAYFDEKANRAAAAVKGGKPYAYPVYHRLDTGSGPNQLNDGDLLAPLLLKVGPTVKAVFSLQAVRSGLEGALARIPQDRTLQAAVADGRHRQPLQTLGGFLDQAGGVPGVGRNHPHEDHAPQATTVRSAV